MHDKRRRIISETKKAFSLPVTLVVIAAVGGTLVGSGVHGDSVLLGLVGAALIFASTFMAANWRVV